MRMNSAVYVPEGEVITTHFPSGRVCLVSSGANLTLNLPQYNDDYSNEYVFVKDYSENEGVLQSLVDSDIVSGPVAFVRSCYVDIPVCKLLPRPCREW